MECRAYGICLDSQSRGYLGKDRKVSSAAGGNLSRMHKTEETAKESRLNFMYSHLRNRTLVCNGSPSTNLNVRCPSACLSARRNNTFSTFSTTKPCANAYKCVTKKILIPFSNNAHTICLPISEPSLSFVAANDSLNSTIEFDVILSAISLILLSSSSNFPLFMVASSSRL